MASVWAAVGAVIGELLKTVVDTKSRAVGFNSDLNRLESTLKSISPIIKEIEELKKELDRPDEELGDLIELLNKGNKLLLKCSKISRWNSYKKPHYAKKLQELGECILRFFHINMQLMQARQTRDTMQILKEVQDMTSKLDGLNNPIGLLGSCRVPEHQPLTVGLDVPLRELSAPGGCGKTTLVKMLCRDEEVKGAALGALCLESLKTGLHAKNKMVGFNSSLRRLKATLESTIPIVKEIKELKENLDHPKEELEGLIELLNDGEKLVQKCSNISRWKFWKRQKYTRKLLKSDTSIKRFGSINIPLLQCRDNLKILVLRKEVSAKFDQILSQPNGGFNNPIGFLGSCGVPEPPPLQVGLDVPLRDLKMWLLNNGTQVLVLSAPGGCGKTTLAKKLCIDEEVKGKFEDNIFFVTASKMPNLKVIIQKLIQHKGYQVPEFQSDEDAVNQLEQLLKKIGPGPVFLVLDDIWSGSESLLEKFVFQIPDYKILVTSRSVIHRFETYNLKLLNDEDAMTLFCHSAFPQGSLCGPDDDLVNKVVKNFKGFPLALKVVGRSLCGQPPFIWQSKVKDWSKESIFSSEIDLFECLQPSLDVLDNKLKGCFMDLGSFPEDQRIPAAALIDMWVELYNLDEDGVYAMANLHELSTRNLVNLVVTRKDESEVDGYYYEHFVTQHDLLRELAIYHSNKDPIEQRRRLFIDISGNNIPKWCMELKQQLISVCLLSISTDETFSSSWFNMQLPNVEVLVLNFQTKNYTLPEFVEKMDKLKVLIVMNNGFCPAELSNFPLLGSLSSLKRIRLENISISSFSNVQLKNLQKISFIMCRIGQAFKNCTIQLPNMFPNLIEINIDYCNDLVELPESLCEIVHLKKLSITNCHKFFELPERIGNLENLEALRLHACTELLELPGSIGSLQKLRFLDISDCLSMWRMPEQMGQLCNLRKLHMRGCSSLSELPPTIKDLEHLKDVFCDEETSILWESIIFDLPNLKVHVPEENINLHWLHNLHF